MLLQVEERATPMPPLRRSAARQRRVLLGTVKCTVSALLIAWILHSTDLGEVFRAARSADVPLLVLAFSLHFVGFYISTRRWKLLLAAQGVHASIRHLFGSFMVGVFFSNLLPSTVGGDAYRAYDSWRLGAGKAAAVVVTLVDRFLGLVALLLFVVVALVLSKPIGLPMPLPQLWVLGGGAATLMLLWTIFGSSARILRLASGLVARVPGPLRRVLARLDSAFSPFRGRVDALAQAFGLSVLLQANVVVYYYLIARALDFSVSLPHFFFIVPVALFVMMVPVSINAIGLRENVFAYLFAFYAIPTAAAVAFAWIAYGMVMVQGLLGGLVYALRTQVVPRDAPEGESELAARPMVVEAGNAVSSVVLDRAAS